MFGLGRDGLPKRSPICKKALTWTELSKLPPGTELIRYNWDLHRQEAVVLLFVFGSSHDALLREVRFGREFIITMGDLGVEPYVSVDKKHRWWNEANVIVLPKDVKALPASKKPSRY